MPSSVRTGASRYAGSSLASFVACGMPSTIRWQNESVRSTEVPRETPGHSPWLRWNVNVSLVSPPTNATSMPSSNAARSTRRHSRRGGSRRSTACAAQWSENVLVVVDRALACETAPALSELLENVDQLGAAHPDPRQRVLAACSTPRPGPAQAPLQLTAPAPVDVRFVILAGKERGNLWAAGTARLVGITTNDATCSSQPHDPRDAAGPLPATRLRIVHHRRRARRAAWLGTVRTSSRTLAGRPPFRYSDHIPAWPQVNSGGSGDANPLKHTPVEREGRESLRGSMERWSVRMQRILGPGPATLMIPLDDSLISGPRTMPLPPSQLASIAAGVGADSVMGYLGLFKAFNSPTIGRVVNLTASTAMSNHTAKVAISTPLDAVRVAADAVAVHINFSAPDEGRMLEMAGALFSKAISYGLPCLAIAYPRTVSASGEDENYLLLKEEDPSQYADLIAHAVRASVDLGASVVKTQYTGSVASMRRVVAAADGVPVLVAGGALATQDEVFATTAGALEAGVRGVSIGRNFFGRSDPATFGRALRSALDASRPNVTRPLDDCNL
jgi:DhnA family fructose-bisphosphate aldolase class Ia